MFGANGNCLVNDTAIMFIKEYFVFFIAAILLCTPIAKRFNKLCVEERMNKVNKVAVVVYPVALMILFFVSVSYLVIGSYNPFIYFNF